MSIPTRTKLGEYIFLEGDAMEAYAKGELTFRGLNATGFRSIPELAQSLLHPFADVLFNRGRRSTERGTNGSTFRDSTILAKNATLFARCQAISTI
jgi:hypothetical protein